MTRKYLPLPSVPFTVGFFLLCWGSFSVLWGQTPTFNPSVEVLLNGQPAGSAISAGTNPDISRVTSFFGVDDLPRTRYLRVNTGAVDWPSLVPGTPFIQVDLAVSATVSFLGTVQAGTAKIAYSVQSNSGSSVELAATIQEITLSPLVSAVLKQEQKDAINAFIGYLATVATLAPEGGSGFVLNETYNIPPGTEIPQSVKDVNLKIQTTDTFLTKFFQVPSEGERVLLAADPAAGGTLTFTSGLTSLNHALSVGPITSEFTVEGAASFNAYFPMFLNPQGDFYGIAFSNATDADASIELSLFGKDGSLGAYANNPKQDTVGSLKQFVGLARDIFGIPAGTYPEGWIELSSDNEMLGGFALFGDDHSLRLDGGAAVLEKSMKVYLTRVFEGSGQFRGEAAATTISVANPNDSPVTVSLLLKVPAAGATAEGSPEMVETVAEVERQIPAKGVLMERIGQLFGEDAVSGHVEVEVTQGDGIVAAESVRLANYETIFALNGAGASAGSPLYSAQLADLPDLLFTSLKLINISGQQRNLTLTAIKDDGSNYGSPQLVTMEAGEVLEADAGTLFPAAEAAALGQIPSADPLIGSLKVEVPGGGVIGDAVFGLTNFNYAAALPLQETTFKKAVFSHVANISGFFFTGLALFNPGSVDAAVAIDVYKSDGTLSGSKNLTLNPGRRMSDVLETLIPSTIGQTGGFIVISSDQPLVAQELFGRNDSKLLSAVPPRVLE